MTIAEGSFCLSHSHIIYCLTAAQNNHIRSGIGRASKVILFVEHLLGRRDVCFSLERSDKREALAQRLYHCLSKDSCIEIEISSPQILKPELMELVLG